MWWSASGYHNKPLFRGGRSVLRGVATEHLSRRYLANQMYRVSAHALAPRVMRAGLRSRARV